MQKSKKKENIVDNLGSIFKHKESIQGQLSKKDPEFKKKLKIRKKRWLELFKK